MKTPPIWAIAKNGKHVRIPYESLQPLNGHQVLRDHPSNLQDWRQFLKETGYSYKRYFGRKLINGDWYFVWREKPLMTKMQKVGVAVVSAVVLGVISLASIWSLTSIVTPLDLWRAGISLVTFGGMLVCVIVAIIGFSSTDWWE